MAAAGDSAEDARQQQRILRVKIEIDWKKEDDRQLYNRLRDLGWQAARYRNMQAMARYGESMGWKKTPEDDDPHGLTKLIRHTEKQDLSGGAYSAAEREVAAAFARDGKRIYAGQPFPQWRPSAALTVRGHKRKAESSIRLELEYGVYVAYLQAQSEKSIGWQPSRQLWATGCTGSTWLRLVIAPNTRSDEYLAPTLNRMVSWDVPVRKASVQIKPHGIVLSLTYAIDRPLPAMGERIATLGPVAQDGRLHLRTETDGKDYTAKLNNLLRRKDEWDRIRRRVLAQIGRCAGHARAKRERLARLDWSEWLRTYLHTWSRELVDWTATQGVGTIRIESIGTGDWPAHQFIELIRYKAADAGIAVIEGADITTESGARAAKAVIGHKQQAIRKRREALRELTHQLTVD